MTDAAPAIVTLSTRLCPWLREPLARFDAARESSRLGHAWLINGPSGIGKLNLALVFAHRMLNAAHEPPPALDPDAAATAMREGRAPADHHPDLHWIFPAEDKRTISVDQIRDLAEALSLKGFRSEGKVAIIEPAEAMTVAAANALLKTLEEPAERTYLLLVSHRPNRLLPTIRSRCQSLAVAAPPPSAVAEWLGIDAPDADPIMLLAGRAPLRALELREPATLRFLNSLQEQIKELSNRKIEARAVAETWIKQSPELALQWLVRRLEHAIRLRAAPDSKAVTSLREDPLHNAWLALPPRALFEQREAAEKLLGQLGSGINVELALHALLLGFQIERGRM